MIGITLNRSNSAYQLRVVFLLYCRSIRWSTQYSPLSSRVIIAKSIAGFLNADGGRLVIGVKEIKDQDEVQVIGVNSEIPKLKDKTLDGYRRMLLDSVILPYFPSFVFNRINDHLKI